jgi:CubicO group peptidase (beta-lactamase class C family)
MSPIGPFDNPDPRKSQITLAALMTHTSGLACDDNDDNSPGNEDLMQAQSRQPNWWKYTLDLPMANSPGVRYAYCSGGMNLVGGALTATTQTWLPALFDETIARPLRFGRYYWNLMPTYDGYLGGGAYVLPRDFLKLGQAYLNGGVWNGTRIVDEAWIRDSTAPRVPITEATTGLSAQQFPQFYIASPGDGYAWHSNDLHYGERVFHAFQASGNGGQLLVVVPAVQLSVVITAGNYGEGGIWNNYPQQLIGDGIIPAILCVKGGQC